MDPRHESRPGGPLAIVTVILVVLTAVLSAHTYISRLLEHIAPDLADIIIAIVTIAWWYFAAWLAARLVRRVSPRFLFPFDSQPRRRKIVSDLVAGLIYLAAIFGILKFAFHQPIEGLLATSGIVAIVLGLALQSTLADLFSGIALNIENPFRAGDWITVDGGTEGQIVEINWRATRIRDRNGDTTVIPNSQIAKSRVTNHSLPEKAHPSSVNIDIDTNLPANEVNQILISAVLGAKHVLSIPAPDVTIQTIRGRTASYCVSFYVADFAEIPTAQSDVLTQILAHTADGRLRLARPQTDVFIASLSRPNHPAAPIARTQKAKQD